MILHHDHAFAEDAVFNYKVCWSLGYNAAAAQAELIFITAHFEMSILLSGQYYNIQYFVAGRDCAKHERKVSEDKIKGN
jgi:hypothetical protein